MKGEFHEKGKYLKMGIESAKKYIEDQIVFYDKYLIGIEEERNELRHKLDLVQQRYEIYVEKKSDYKTILDKMAIPDGFAARSATITLEGTQIG